MEDRKHFFEDVCIPRNEFIKEHVHLLNLLRHGDRTQLLAEAKSQEAELKGKTGGVITLVKPTNVSAMAWKKMTPSQKEAAIAAALAARAAAAKKKVEAAAAERHKTLGEAAKRHPSWTVYGEKKNRR